MPDFARLRVVEYRGLDLSSARIWMDPGAAQRSENFDYRHRSKARVRAGYARLLAGSTSPENSQTVTDDFDRADGGLGSNWTVDTGGSMDLAIDTNVVKFTGGDATIHVAYGRYVGSSFNNDQYAQITYDSGTPETDFFVGVRRTSAQRCYMVYGRPGTVVFLSRVDYSGGFLQERIIDTSTLTLSSGDTLLLRAYGTTLEGFINGVLAVSGTDDSISSGTPGFGFVNDSAAATTDDRLDDFAAGNVVAQANVVKVSDAPSRVFAFERDDEEVRVLVANATRVDAFLAGEPEWTS